MPRNVLRIPFEYPPVHNLGLRNENFSGREQEMLEIGDILRRHKVAIIRSDPSLPVSGKTETAIEYAHRNHIHYDVVWVFDCLNADGLAAQFDRLSDELETIGARVPAMRSAMWLFVFDGTDGPIDLPDWLPPRVQVDQLLTAPGTGSRADHRSIVLGELDRQASRQLLTRLAPMLNTSDTEGLLTVLGGRPALLWEVGRLIASEDPITGGVCLRLLTMLPSASPPDPPVGGAITPVNRAAPRIGRIPQRALFDLVGRLEKLEFMSDPASRQTWLQLIRQFSGHPVRLPETSYLPTLLINLLRLAATSPTPDILVAIRDATEGLIHGEHTADEIREEISRLASYW